MPAGVRRRISSARMTLRYDANHTMTGGRDRLATCGAGNARNRPRIDPWRSIRSAAGRSGGATREGGDAVRGMRGQGALTALRRVEGETGTARAYLQGATEV